MNDLQLLIQWEEYKRLKTKESLKKFVEPFFIHFASLLDQYTLNSSILAGPCLSDLPPEVLHVLSDRLEEIQKQLNAAPFHDESLSHSQTHLLLLIKFVYLLSRNIDNHKILCESHSVNTVFKICYEEFKKIPTFTSDNNDSTTSWSLHSLNYCMLILESLLDPYLKWRSWKKSIYNRKQDVSESKSSGLKNISTSVSPLSATEEHVIWFYDALLLTRSDRQIRERVLHLYCSALSGSPKNAQILITPATVDALQLHVDSNDGSCGMICTTEVLITGAYVINILSTAVPVHERQEDLSLLCQRFLAALRRKSHLNQHECYSIHRIMLDCEELSHLFLCHGLLPIFYNEFFNTFTVVDENVDSNDMLDINLPEKDDISIVLIRCLAWLSNSLYDENSWRIWDNAMSSGKGMPSKSADYTRRQQFITFGGYGMLMDKLCSVPSLIQLHGPQRGEVILTHLFELLLSWALGIQVSFNDNTFKDLWDASWTNRRRSFTGFSSSLSNPPLIVDPHVLRCLLLWIGKNLFVDESSYRMALNYLTFLYQLCCYSRVNVNLCCNHAFMEVILSHCLTPLLADNPEKEPSNQITATPCRKIKKMIRKKCLELVLLLGEHSLTSQDLYAFLALIKNQNMSSGISDLLKIFALMARPNTQLSACYWLEMDSREAGILICPSSFTCMSSSVNTSGQFVIGTETLTEIDSRMHSTTMPNADTLLLNASGTNMNGFTLQVWLSLDRLSLEAQKSVHRRMLFRWLTRSGHGLEAFFTPEGELLVATIVAGEYHCVQIKCNSSTRSFGEVIVSPTRTAITTNGISSSIFPSQRENHWHLLHIVWSNAHGWFGQSLVQIYLDGEMHFQTQMKFPKLNDSLILCHVGGCPVNVEKECMDRVIKLIGSPNARGKRRLWATGNNMPVNGVPGVVQKLHLGQETDIWGVSQALNGQVMSVAGYVDALTEAQIRSIAAKGIHDLNTILLTPEEQSQNTLSTLTTKVLFYYHAKAWVSGCVTDLSPSISGLSARFGQWCANGTVVSGGCVPLPALLTARRLSATRLPDVVQRAGGISLLLPMLKVVEKLTPEMKDGDVECSTPVSTTFCPISSEKSLPPFSHGSVDQYYEQPFSPQFSLENDSPDIPTGNECFNTGHSLSHIDGGVTDGITSFLIILRNLLLSPATQQHLLENKNVQVMGFLIEQFVSSHFTEEVLESTRSLIDSLGLPKTKHKFYRHLLWQWSLWCCCPFPVRRLHLQYVATLLKQERSFFREKLGVKGILDAIRDFHRPPDVTSTTEDLCKPLRRILYNMLRTMIAKHFVYQDVLDLLVFIHTCGHDVLLHESIELLIQMFENAGKGDQVTLLMYEQGLCESLYLLLTRADVSLVSKEKIIEFLHKLTISQRVPSRHKKHIFLDQRGGFAGLFAHEHFHPHLLSTSTFVRLMDMLELKAAIDPVDFIQVLPFLSAVPNVHRKLALQTLQGLLTNQFSRQKTQLEDSLSSHTSPVDTALLKKVTNNPASSAGLIFPQPAWYNGLCHFFIRRRLSQTPPLSSSGNDEIRSHLPRSTSSDVYLPSRVTGESSSKTVCCDCQRTEKDHSLDNEMEMKHSEDMCFVLCQCLAHIMWWGGVGWIPSTSTSGRWSDDNISPHSAWLIRHEVFQNIEDIARRYELWKPSYWIYQELMKFMLKALMEQMLTSDAISLTEDARQLIFLIRSMFCEDRLRQDCITDVTVVEQSIRLLRDYLRVWDVSMGDWSELSAVGLQLILTWCDPVRQSEEVHSCACARLHDLLNTQGIGLETDGSLVSQQHSVAALMSYDEVAYVLMRLNDHIDIQLQITNAKGDGNDVEEDMPNTVIGYYFLIPIVKTLLSRYAEILQLQQFAPNLPSPRGLEFNEGFKAYAFTTEWRHFITHKVRSAVEVYECQNLSQVSRDVSLYRAQAYESMLQAREFRKRLLVKAAHWLDDELYDKLVQCWIDKEHRRREKSGLLQAHKRQRIGLLATQLCDNWPYGPNLPEHWQLSPLENRSRMRPKLEPNSHWHDHREAAELRDQPYRQFSELPQELDLTEQLHLSSTVTRRHMSQLEEDHLNDEDWSRVEEQMKLQQQSDQIGDKETPSKISTVKTKEPLTITNSPGSSSRGSLAPSLSLSSVYNSLPMSASISGLSTLSAFGDASETETKLISVKCQLITIMQIVSGRLEITSSQLTFYDMTSDEDDPQNARHDLKCHLSSLREIHLRRYNLRRSAVEIFLLDQRNFFFNFDVKNRDRVYSCILGLRLPNLVHSKSRSPADILRTSQLTERWCRHEISNFDYLMQLNTIAGRTFNDLSQYPVFPWILADYKSKRLDLTNLNTFRDLSKPIGVVNQKNSKEVEEKYESFEDPQGIIDKFHYGTHYSSAAGVMHYMIRMEPFTTLHIQLQSGKFDVADRQFYSIPSAWQFIMESPNDNKELIPEFFYLTEFLENINGFNLGRLQFTKSIIDHVELPLWANQNPWHFIYWHRQALECELVSQQLHHWIDLIFGYQQKGPDAVKALNIFYYVTYEGAVDLDSIEDKTERQCFESMISNFGQTPCQLVKEPHPRKLSREEYAALLKRQDRLPNLLQILDEQSLQRSEICVDRYITANSESMGHLQLRYQGVLAASNSTHDPLIFICVPPSQLRQGQLFLNQEKSQLIIGVSSQLQLSRNSWIRNERSNNFGFSYEPDASNLPSLGRKRNNLGVLDPELRAHLNPFINPCSGGNVTGYNNTNLSSPGIGSKQLLTGSATTGMLYPAHQLFAVTRDSRWLFCGGQWDNSLLVYNLHRSRVEHRVGNAHAAVITCLHLSECSTSGGVLYFITGAKDGSSSIWTWSHSTSTGPPRVLISISSARISRKTLLGANHSLGGGYSSAVEQVSTTHDISLRSVALQWELDVAVTADIGGYICVYSVASQRLLHLIKLNQCAQLLALLMEPELAHFQALWMRLPSPEERDVPLEKVNEPRIPHIPTLQLSLYNVNARLVNEINLNSVLSKSTDKTSPAGTGSMANRVGLMVVTCALWHDQYLLIGTAQGDLIICHAYLHYLVKLIHLQQRILHISLSIGASHILIVLSDGSLVIVQM